MNKISGILPTSARIESVDMSRERPLRAGTATFGQPVNATAKRPSPIQTDTVGGLSAEYFNRDLKKSGQKSDVDIVRDMSEAFFAHKKERGPGLIGVGQESNALSEASFEEEVTPKRLSVYA